MKDNKYLIEYCSEIPGRGTVLRLDKPAPFVVDNGSIYIEDVKYEYGSALDAPNVIAIKGFGNFKGKIATI